ncbi:MAG: RluA family pseudouridine synthase [Candidatus Aminicenantes bacterium]|nr:MAG: RluA family pseudouridine synthase [Candidatus Aminicenantes bacterium]
MRKRFKANKDYPRLDHFLTESLKSMSRSRVVKLINEGRVKLNNQPMGKKNIHIRVGDVLDVELEEPEQKEHRYQPFIELKKLFEDDYLLILDKPGGISVHPGSGERGETMLDIFRYYYPQINEIKDTDRPGIVHRLDKDTSGVLLLAKDLITMKRLQKQFKRREVKKTYLALVHGQVRYRNGTIDAPIGRSPRHRTRYKVIEAGSLAAEISKAREAITEFSVIRQYQDFSFVKLSPLTGRTHQLRVHLSYYGNPILGDTTYGKKGKNRTFERLALHAYSLEFHHPITGNVIYSYSMFPEVFRNFLCQKGTVNRDARVTRRR